MDEDYAIKVENLHKSFRLPHEKHTSLKQAALNFHKRSYDNLEVLKGLNFEIKQGEFFGIVGRNGSGKSTLLKTIAGIYEPDKGSVHVKGDLTPFVELGIGFNPELTGRDNVYLNGAILGMDREEVNDIYDEIVEFAELEKFMDQKLKNYSSGMQVRLAFSVAIRAHNSILLIDEVIAVGDENFQNKCVDYFAKIKKDQDQTIVLVTHDMNWVERFCDRAMVIHEGKIMGGVQKPHEVHMLYSQINQKVQTEEGEEDEEPNRWGSRKVEIENIDILNAEGQPSYMLETGKTMSVEITISNLKDVKTNLVVGLGVYDEADTYIYGPNSKGEQISPEDKTITYRISELPLNTGRYFLTVGIFDEDSNETYDFMDKTIEFKVVNENTENNRGKLVLEGEWKHE